MQSYGGLVKKKFYFFFFLNCTNLVMDVVMVGEGVVVVVWI